MKLVPFLVIAFVVAFVLMFLLGGWLFPLVGLDGAFGRALGFAIVGAVIAVLYLRLVRRVR